MVSPIDVRCWVCYIAWLMYIELKFADTDEPMFVNIFVLLAGVFGIFLILNKIFPDAPMEEDSEENPTTLF